MSKKKTAGRNELKIMAQVFLEELRGYIKSGNSDMAKAMISSVSVGLTIAHNADSDMQEAFGMALDELVVGCMALDGLLDFEEG